MELGFLNASSHLILLKEIKKIRERSHTEYSMGPRLGSKSEELYTIPGSCEIYALTQT